jgi:hypothetical protein
MGHNMTASLARQCFSAHFVSPRFHFRKDGCGPSVKYVSIEFFYSF